MAGGWKRIDLAGGGLQSASVRIAAALKRRGTAYGLLALFPLGLHRSYLDDPRGAWAYRGATLLCTTSFALGWAAAATAVCAFIAAAALADLLWIDRRIIALNRRIRIEAWLGHGVEPPPGFRGRFTEGSAANALAAEKLGGGHAPPAPAARRRVPTIAEQERLLAEAAKQPRAQSRDT